MKTSFSHITDWVFDLDNTLYPSHCNLFAEMDKRITRLCNAGDGQGILTTLGKSKNSITANMVQRFVD